MVTERLLADDQWSTVSLHTGVSRISQTGTCTHGRSRTVDIYRTQRPSNNDDDDDVLGRKIGVSSGDDREGRFLFNFFTF